MHGEGCGFMHCGGLLNIGGEEHCGGAYGVCVV